MTTLELEAGREYQYRYLLNGNEWHNDWHADRYVSNAYGGDNSVVITPCFVEDEVGAERVIAFTPSPRRQVPAS
jgi:hypothetical protein